MHDVDKYHLIKSFPFRKIQIDFYMFTIQIEYSQPMAAIIFTQY